MSALFRRFLFILLVFAIGFPYAAQDSFGTPAGAGDRGLHSRPWTATALDRQAEPVQALVFSRNDLYRELFPDNNSLRITCPKTAAARSKSKENLRAGPFVCGVARLRLCLRCPLPPPSVQ